MIITGPVSGVAVLLLFWYMMFQLPLHWVQQTGFEVAFSLSANRGVNVPLQAKLMKGGLKPNTFYFILLIFFTNFELI